MFLLIKFTLLYAVVLMLVAMGGMFSERSGVINIALEGIMAIGGLAGVFVLVLFPDLPAPALVALSILASAVSGMIYSLLLGFSAITLKADQTIGGTALNMLATAIAIVLVKAFNNGSDAGNGAASAKLNQRRFHLQDRTIYREHLPVHRHHPSDLQLRVPLQNEMGTAPACLR